MDIGKIIRRIAGAYYPAAYLFVPVIRLKDRLEGGGMRRSLGEAIDAYCTEDQKNDAAFLRRTKRDMWYSFILYHAAFNEYFLYHFPLLSHEGRRTFVLESEKNELCENMSQPEVWHRIWDKWSAYQLFRDFYHREAIAVGADASPEEFRAFLAKHPRFIAKPRLESCGVGVTIYDAAAAGFDADAVFASLRGIDVICEELIVQADELACLHPGSVNTVRVATLIKDGAPVVLFTFLRIGRGGSIVDNAGAGGFAASVDKDTGVVLTPGVTERLAEAVVHPDTGVQILGLRLPDWESLVATAKRAAMVYPDHPYISWDFAYTEAGWVIVEANCMGQFICPQFTTGRGIRPYLQQYFDL